MSLHEEESDSERIEMNPLLQAGSSTTSTSERWRPRDFKKRECNTFIEDSSSDGRCQCGRHRDTHPTHINTAVDTEWTSELHSSEQPTDAFGWMDIKGVRRAKRFLRLASDTEPSAVYDMMTWRGDGDMKTVSTMMDDGWWCWHKPSMVVSVLGGEGSAEVNPWVQKVIRQGLVKALEDKGDRSWILTEGFDEGTERCVGEAVEDSKRVRALGITPWGFVHNRDQLVSQGGRVEYSVENTTSESCCLEKNHDGFLLVDDGSEGRKGGEKNFSVKLEEHISTQHIEDSSSINIPVLNMLISGETTMLERVGVSLENSTPWLVLAGSGGVADLLSDILEGQSPASDGVDVARVRELIRKLKPCPSEAQTDQLVEQVQSIYQNRELITFYHEEQSSEDFDTVMIKALMPASKRRASGTTFPYCKELCLAMRWNRVDFASSELFNDDNIDYRYISEGEALEDFMRLALIRDQPQFVRLLIEKKFNIEEYLTYGVLEKLYSKVDKGTPIYKQLLERLKQRLGTSDLDSLEEISLFEVSGVLKKFMGEEKPFYFPVLGLKDFTSGKKTLERFKELLEGEPSYRKRRCKSPWTHLFIWAVLQNHSDWAVFFWEMQEEDSVQNALSACKMLTEMSEMEERGTKTKRSMKELAQKFENLAHAFTSDLLGACCQSDEVKSFRLLNTKSPVWGTNCFQMAMADESLPFFNHDGLESMLSRVWWGGADTWWQYLVMLLLPCWAPVSVFVSNTVMYIVFLILFAYMLLVDFKPPPPSGPSISEYVLYFWVFTFFCEEIRQAFSVSYRYMTFCQKMRLYWKDFWNRCDLLAIILFFIGLICRMFEWSYEFGRGVLCIDYMVFTLRLIHISAINKRMGPKIIIVGKMMKDVASFLFFLGTWIIAYGVATQALLYSYDPNPSRIFRRVFYRPYLYIFGELNLQEIDVGQEWDITCTNNMTQIEGGAEPCRSDENNLLVMILFVVFLLITNVLLINLLIAIISNTFNKVEEKSVLYWRFQHYNLVMEYHARPALPPPFIILSHIGSLFRLLVRRCCDEESYDFFCVSGIIMGLFNRRYGMEEIQEWEMDQKKTFLAERETERSDSERIKQISDNVQEQLTGSRAMDQRIQQISDKVDSKLQQQTETIDQAIQMMTDRVDRMEKQLTEQLTEQFTAQRAEIRDFDQRQRALETKVDQILEALAKVLHSKEHDD